MIELEIKGKPQPWAAHQGYGRRSYDPRAAYKKTSRIQIREQYKGPIIEEAVSLYLYFYMPIPKGLSQKKIEAILRGDVRHIKKPDCTNLQKLIEDCLKGIVLKDDGQVECVCSVKQYSNDPRTVITIGDAPILIQSKL